MLASVQGVATANVYTQTVHIQTGHEHTHREHIQMHTCVHTRISIWGTRFPLLSAAKRCLRLCSEWPLRRRATVGCCVACQ